MRRRARLRVWLCATILACAGGAVEARAQAQAQAQAQAGTSVSMTVEPESVTIGQPFVVRIHVITAKNAIVRFPPVPDSGDAIEAIDPRVVEDRSGDNLDRTAIYRLAAWNTGDHTPHFSRVSVSVGGVEQQYDVTLRPIAVRSMLPADSAERVPKPLRDPLFAASGLWKLWLLLGILAVWMLCYWWRNRRRRAAPPPREVEAYEAANDAFRALDRMKLVQAGEPGRHVIAHVDVMRSYLTRRFPEATMSATPRETVAALDASDFPLRPGRVRELLERDAAIRFAESPLSSDDAQQLAKEATAIVEGVQDAWLARQRAVDRGAKRVRK